MKDLTFKFDQPIDGGNIIGDGNSDFNPHSTDGEVTVSEGGKEIFYSGYTVDKAGKRVIIDHDGALDVTLGARDTEPYRAAVTAYFGRKGYEVVDRGDLPLESTQAEFEATLASLAGNVAHDLDTRDLSPDELRGMEAELDGMRDRIIGVLD